MITSMECPNCEFHCRLANEWSGKCKMYRVSNGTDGSAKIENRFYSEKYISEMGLTSIESVPMFHFKPGTLAFNLGTISCNFDCRYCLNERLARIPPEKSDKINFFTEPPERIIRRANLGKASSIVFGNNEPTVSLNFVLDLAKTCRQNHMPFGISTNGFMTKYALEEILNEGINYVNFDIKSFRPEFLHDIIGIDLNHGKNAKEIFLRNLKLIVNNPNVQVVEVCTPIIHNMSQGDVLDIAKEIAKIDPQIPYHIQRAVPEYQIKEKHIETGFIEDSMENFKKVSEILEYVYFGAFPNTPFIDTICKKCGSIVVKRADHGGCAAQLLENKLYSGFCPNCNSKIKMVV